MKQLKFNPFALVNCRLEIGDKGKNVTEDELAKGIAESKRMRGLITFEDGSKAMGTLQIVLGERCIRLGNEVVTNVMFRQDEYFAPVGG